MVPQSASDGGTVVLSVRSATVNSWAFLTPVLPILEILKQDTGPAVTAAW
jgi:hypothetical protein